MFIFWPKPKPGSTPSEARLGVFYSYRNAQYWELDQKQSLDVLLSDFDFEWVTLPFFWNEMVDEHQNLKLETLNEQIETAKVHNLEVIITLGLKAPGYPEFFYPQKYADSIIKGSTITIGDPVSEEFLQILPKVVKDLSKNDNIKAWQIENEPLWTSQNGLKISTDLIQKEIEIVRREDQKNRPVLLNHPATPPWNNDSQKVMGLLKKGDYLGINVHTKTRPPVLVYFKLFGKLISVPWPDFINIPVYNLGPLSPNLQKLKTQADKRELKTIITELQSEPYFTDNKKLQGRALFNFNPRDIETNVQLAKNAGIDQITLWGSSFWLYSKQNGNNEWVDSVKNSF